MGSVWWIWEQWVMLPGLSHGIDIEAESLVFFFFFVSFLGLFGFFFFAPATP
jgi:hypothetical protein